MHTTQKSKWKKSNWLQCKFVFVSLVVFELTLLVYNIHCICWLILNSKESTLFHFTTKSARKIATNISEDKQLKHFYSGAFWCGEKKFVRNTFFNNNKVCDSAQFVVYICVIVWWVPSAVHIEKIHHHALDELCSKCSTIFFCHFAYFDFVLEKIFVLFTVPLYANFLCYIHNLC